MQLQRVILSCLTNAMLHCFGEFSQHSDEHRKPLCRTRIQTKSDESQPCALYVLQNKMSHSWQEPTDKYFLWLMTENEKYIRYSHPRLDMVAPCPPVSESPFPRLATERPKRQKKVSLTQNLNKKTIK